ncbi:hypothetical protein G9A89_008434 [Geosiphon pyriformis]|nr:hypothetical protein G9A89_008434 [Geosiphon pyriformis]
MVTTIQPNSPNRRVFSFVAVNIGKIVHENHFTTSAEIKAPKEMDPGFKVGK